MFSANVVIGIFAVISIAISAIFFVVSKESERLKGFRRAVFIGVSAVFVGVYMLFLSHVYILNKANESYDHKILLFPSSFTFDDKVVVNIAPKFDIGGSTYIINNSERDAVFEVVVYGSAQDRPDVLLPKNQIVYVDHAVDYIFTTPPDSVKIKGSGTTKGYIDYYR